MHWTKETLADVSEIISGFAFKSKDFKGVGIPVVKIKNINPPYVDVSSAECINEDEFDLTRLRRYELRTNDFIVAMTGATIGKVGRINYAVKSYLNQRVALIRPKPRVDQRFIYYSVISTGFENHIHTYIDSHSVQANISAKSIGKFPINLPPLQEQKAIAEVLSSLDDKIELLQKQNETLEALAQTLFRQWFIEEADDSWEEVELGDLVDITSGYVHKAHELVESEAKPLLGMGVIGSSFLLKKEKARFISSNNYKSSQIVDKESIILSTRDITQEAEMLGLPVLADDSFLGSIVGSNMYLLRSLSAPTLYVFHSLRTQRFRQYVKENASGSTILMLRKGDLVKYRLRLPKTGYGQIDTIELLHKKIEKNTNQSMTLRHIRDTLLPKLMSGQVRVKLD